MGVSRDELEELYVRRYRSLRHAAAAIIGDFDRAHDVVQEAFARGIAARAAFRGGSLDAWMFRIVERQAFDARRAPAEQPLYETFELEVADPERDPELAAAMRALSPRRRLVVFLRYFADLPYAEIARLCSIDEGTVAATLAQARADLRRALEPEGVQR
jgi:RNA polymerase sigma factor (sigma-70 family)